MAIETARIVEVFSSIQGEGPLVGVRQVFIRFFGCNVRCIYCDTPNSLANPGNCLVETFPGSREFQERANPIVAEDFGQILHDFARVPHHSVSLTGGEPLLHASFLRRVLPRLKAAGLQIYLETNGILSKQLEGVLEWLDIISMDIKLPTTLNPQHDFFPEHEEFLRLAAAKQVFVKVVILPDTAGSEVVRAAQLVGSVNPSIPLILQPVTPSGGITASPSPEHMLHMHALASGTLHSVRVIPQIHKVMGQL